MRLVLTSIVIVACGGPVEPQVGARPISQGGTFDLRLCKPGVAAPTRLFPERSSTTQVALAVCGDLQADNTATVSGDVRVLGATRVSSPMTVSGSLFSGQSLTSPNTIHVDHNVVTAGDWLLSAPGHVFGDVTVAGNVQHDNTLEVDGTLTARSESGSGALTATTVLLTSPTVTAPLDCGAAPDVHAAAAKAEANLDPRASEAIDPTTRLTISQPTELTLGCGQYVVAGLDVNNTLTVHIGAPTVWVIHGDLNVAAPMVIDVADGASLELVIDGALNADNTLTLGDAEHMSVVAVSGGIRIASPVHVYGALLAPASSVAADNTLDVYGAMFVGPTRVASPLNVHPGLAIGVEGWPVAEAR